MHFVTFTCFLIFHASLTQSQLLTPLKSSLSSLANDILKPRSSPYCAKNSSSNTTPSCSVPFESFAASSTVAGSEIHANDSVFPPWMNLTLAKRGQDFANDYLFGNILAHGYGLIYTVSLTKRYINDLLIFTHKSDTGPRAVLRYYATMTQVLNWYQGDLTGTTNTAVTTSLRKVRDLHINAATRAKATLSQGEPLVPDSYYDNRTFNTQLWDAFYKDLENSNISQKHRQFPSYFSLFDNQSVPMSQLEQALTQFAFIGLPVLYPERCFIGLDATDDDLWAFNHLWAVLGYGLGIKDEFNIALQPNLTATKQYYQRIFDEYFLPTLFTSNQNSTKVLVESVLEALEDIATEVVFTAHTVMYRLLKHIINIPAPNVYSLFTDEEKVFEAAIEAQYLPLLNSDPGYRAALNTAIVAAYKVAGTRYFGTSFATTQSRAEEVYYA